MADEQLRTGHIGLNVTELNRSIDYYAHVFGFELAGRSDTDGRRYAFLGRDGTLVLTLWEQSAQGFATDRAGLHHVSFQVPDVSAVKQIEDRVRGIGGVIRDDAGAPGEPSAGGQLFFFDPDGIRLEVFAAQRPAVPVPQAAATGPACGFF